MVFRDRDIVIHERDELRFYQFPALVSLACRARMLGLNPANWQELLVFFAEGLGFDTGRRIDDEDRIGQSFLIPEMLQAFL